MTWYIPLSVMFGLVCVLMAVGLPVAFCFMLANIVGAILYMGGGIGIETLVRGTMSAISNFGLAPIPFFLVIGELLLRTGLVIKAIDAIDVAIRKVPGRLSVVAVTGGTVFSALSGSTVATTAMLGQSLVPNMLKRGYHPTLTTGPVMAVGGVDMLVPPSNLVVIFATVASSVSIVKISVAALLIAGLVPGLIMSVGFVAYIVIRCWLNPSLAPDGPPPPTTFRGRWMPLLVDVVPLTAIFAVMTGSMYMGWAAPTDSAAVGCVATLAYAAARRALTWKAIMGALMSTAVVTTMIFFIVAASTTFAQILAISGATDGALNQLSHLQLTPLQALWCMIIVLLILGCFMEQIAMMLLTLPFFIPWAAGLNMDMIWVSMVLLISMQVGLLTPPFGMLLFVMRGVAPPEITTRQIWASIVPFVIIILAVLALIVYVPWVATGVVGSM